MKKELYHTNFAVAVSWCNNALVLCNNIPNIDDSIWDNFEPIVNLEYEPEYDEEGEEIKPKCPECGAELSQYGPNMECPECGYCDEQVEIYQWYITDCSKSDVEYLTNAFGLIFTYSDLLDCYILCVTHFGTGWSYVDWYTTNKIAKRELGEKEIIIYVTMKTSICVKSFPGFYETIFDERYIESDQRDQLYELYKGFKHLDDWELPESYRSEVAKEFAEVYISELNDKLGLKMELTSESVESPREYNFTSDQVICYIEVGDWDEFIKKISSLMSLPEYRTELAKIIKENHSDRPGFWSFMSNDIEDWFGAIVDPDNTNYLECVLWYLYCLKSGESIYNDGDWNMSEQIYEELSCSRDTMNLTPITDEAKREWEEWRDKEDTCSEPH